MNIQKSWLQKQCLAQHLELSKQDCAPISVRGHPLVGDKVKAFREEPGLKDSGPNVRLQRREKARWHPQLERTAKGWNHRGVLGP